MTRSVLLLAVAFAVGSLLPATHAHSAEHNALAAIAKRQTNRHDIEKRRLDARGGGGDHGPGNGGGNHPSSTPCSSGYYKSDGTCCAAVNGAKAEDYEKSKCCPKGESYSTYCGCQKSSSSNSKRDMTTMAKREGLPAMYVVPGHRTLLNAELAAQYMMNNGKFEHEGVKYVDSAKWAQEGAEASAYMTALNRIINWTPSMLAVAVPKMFAHHSGEFALSKDYKIHVDDLPEIGNYLFANPDFESISFRHFTFDKDTVKTIYQYFPEEHKIAAQEKFEHAVKAESS